MSASREEPPTTHLILDDQCVSSFRGITFHLNQAEKHPENPVIIPGYPHEWDGLQVNWPSCVVYDPEDALFRCWYHGLEVIQYDVDRFPERKPFAKWLGRLWRGGYAESPDGVNWTKPVLGQYEHRGAPTNAILTDYERSGTGMGWDHFAALSTVWPNPEPESPEQKFLALFTEIGSDEHGNRTFKEFRKVVYSSADGKRWARRMVAYDGSSKDDAPAPNVIDVNCVHHDPSEADPSMRVRFYGQTDRGGNNRGVGMVHGYDLGSLRYDALKVLLEGDKSIEDELHWCSVRKLQNGSYLLTHDSNRFSYDGRGIPDGDIRMAISRDGVDFRRVHPSKPLIPRGSKGMWDANQLVSSSIVEVGDEVYIYYHGTPCIYRPWPYPPKGVPIIFRASVVYPTFMGLAILPRDRFGYAEGDGGEVALSPVKIGEDGLWLNADGQVDVHLEEESGQDVATGSPSEVTRRKVYRKVAWSGTVPPGTYRARLVLHGDARLYSLQT